MTHGHVVLREAYLFYLSLFPPLSLPLCLSSTVFLKRGEFAEKSKKESFYRPDAVNNHMSANTCYNDQYQLSEWLFKQVLRPLSEGWEEVAKAAAQFC